MTRNAFTLRFSDPRTHRGLKLTAELLGVSMNELAERAIAHELAVVGADLEERLTRTVGLLRSYRGENVADDVTRFARAEVSVEDPLRSQMTESSDPHGVGAAFARFLERG
jgi:hypothetical protein